MNLINPMDADMDELFNRLADGLASEADEQRLGDLLRSNPQARQAYRQFMALHAALHWDYIAAVGPARAATSSVAAPAAGSRLKWVAVFAAGVIAACLAVATVMFLVGPRSADKLVTEPSASARNATDDKAPHATAIAALLVDEVAAEFAPGRSPDGVRFGPGDYELLKGVVHLRFAQGADMVLASPARLHVKDAQHIQLEYGKVRVTAPPAAKGFTVATKAADYVDLGTEFGLSVDSDSGASDLYVFDGQVNVADRRSGKVLSQVVQGDSSRYVDGVGAAAPKLKENDFPTPGTIGFERWRKYVKKMRDDHGLIAFYPFSREADESVLANGISDDAMAAGRIVGARWTTGRWPGKDALLFDRDSDYVQFDIPGEHQELTIAAWLKIDRLDFVFNAILNSDGYDLGDIHFQLTRQGFPRGGVVVDGSFHDTVLGKSVPLGNWAHVASVLSTRTRSQQIYVNGVLSRQRQWVSDEVLRPGSCRLGNWLSTSTADPANRALRGRVDELAIWSRALSSEQVKQLVDDGRPGLLWSDQ